jgi:hypothetical protein
MESQLRERAKRPSGPAIAGLPTPKITLHDRVGDAVPAGDLTGVGIAQNSAGTTLEVTVKKPVNPKTDPTWMAGGGLIIWEIDTNGDNQPDDVAAFTSFDSQLEAGVGSFSGANPTCQASAVWGLLGADCGGARRVGRLLDARRGRRGVSVRRRGRFPGSCSRRDGNGTAA